jgi:hypothetical protein
MPLEAHERAPVLRYRAHESVVQFLAQRAASGMQLGGAIHRCVSLRERAGPSQARTPSALSARGESNEHARA